MYKIQKKWNCLIDTYTIYFDLIKIKQYWSLKLFNQLIKWSSKSPSLFKKSEGDLIQFFKNLLHFFFWRRIWRKLKEMATMNQRNDWNHQKNWRNETSAAGYVLKYILRHSPSPGSESEEDGHLGLTPKTPWEHRNSEKEFWKEPPCPNHNRKRHGRHGQRTKSEQ